MSAPFTYDLDLLSHHADLLRASAISPEVAKARGYRSVSKLVELERLGFSVSQRRVPALLIPIRNTTGQVTLHQIRPDTPRIREGRPVKYEIPPHSRMCLDVPQPAHEWIADPRRPLLITEGARKADAAVSRGLCCISLLGVWGFRGTNEHGGLAALGDWESIALDGRDVRIVFDSDVMEKRGVHDALVRLKAFLDGRGTRTRVIYLPPGENGAKTGLDDYLAAGHTVEELFALASAELRAQPDHEGSERLASYAFRDGRMVWLKGSADGAVEVPLTNFVARIVLEIVEDDGAEEWRHFEIEAHLNGRARRFRVPAARFAGMNWVPELLGANAIVSPGPALREHTRAAIQELSGEVPSERVFTHLGWTVVGERWVYLHGAGAIGAEGPITGIAVSLPGALARAVLPAPPQGEEQTKAVRASLRFLEVAPDYLTFPVFASVWRATLGPSDFSLHLTGPTGAGKTELAALAQQHFGKGLDSRHLPGGWSSTGNALEALAFAAKDALIVVDDFAPTGSPADVSRFHREADRLLRAQGNNSGRQRMRADTTLRPAKPPRGLIVSTGEDVPAGQSLRSRLLVLEVSPQSISWRQMTECQRDAALGRYAEALSSFIRWIASRRDALLREMRGHVEELRAAATTGDKHRRTPEIAANLAVGLAYFLDFAQDVGSLDREVAESLWVRGWAAIGKAAATQSRHLADCDPARRFLALLSQAIASGRAHVARPDGCEPSRPEAWGWRRASAAQGEPAHAEWRQQGHLVGWIDDDDLYLLPDVAHGVAQALGRDLGEHLGLSSQTLRKRLNDTGLLVGTDPERGTLLVRRVLQGARRNVLYLRPDVLALYPSREPDQPDHALVAPRMPTLRASPCPEAVGQELVGLVGSNTGIVSDLNGDDGVMGAIPAEAQGGDRRRSSPEVLESRVEA